MISVMDWSHSACRPQPRLEDLPEGDAKRTNEQNKCVHVELTCPSYLTHPCNIIPHELACIYRKKKECHTVEE